MPYTVFAILATLYSALAVRNHEQLRTCGFDLGIFTQQIASYAQLKPPMVPLLGGVNSLGDHFSPATFVLAPVYRLFPSPVTLLIAQAMLFAVAAIPLVRWATAALGGWAGAAVGLGYGLSFGIQGAINYDFHEIALAVPLLAFAMTALGQQRWTAGLAWSLPLVFVKEDLGLTVAMIGGLVALWATGRDRVRGALTVVWGLGWTALATKVLIPWFSGDGHYAQGDKLGPGALEQAARGVLGSADLRAATLFLLLLITGFAAVRSPLVLIALPTIGWRFASENSNFWGPIYHYNAVLMPIVFAALIHALGRERPRVRGYTLATVAAVAVAAAPFLPLDELRHAQTWRTDPQVSAARNLPIPAGATVGASNNLAPQLVSTYTVTVFPHFGRDRSTPEWLVVNVARPPRWPQDPTGDQEAIQQALRSGYTEVGTFEGIRVLRR